LFKVDFKEALLIHDALLVDEDVVNHDVLVDENVVNHDVLVDEDVVNHDVLLVDEDVVNHDVLLVDEDVLPKYLCVGRLEGREHDPLLALEKISLHEI